MPQILKVSSDYSEEKVIADAAAIVARGGIIAYPTETIYGLGVDAADEQAVRRIFEVKGRDFHNPVSVIIGNLRDVYPLVRNIPVAAQKLMNAFWPGPLTIVFEAADSVSPLLTAGTGKLGVRLSGHAGARKISQKAERPLTATSANLSGAPECTSAEEVALQIGSKIDAIIDLGKTAGITGSTIIDVTSRPARILRQGSISPDLIRPYGIFE